MKSILIFESKKENDILSLPLNSYTGNKQVAIAFI